jgi:hypothetical protein
VKLRRAIRIRAPRNAVGGLTGSENARHIREPVRMHDGDRETLSFRERDVDPGKPRLDGTRHDLSGMSTDHADSRFRGLPPLAPLALAAAAFALDLRRPPRRPVEAANKRVPNTRSTSPGT